MKITGSVALVTGANRGLGKAYVEALLSSGVGKVYARARDLSKITDSRVIPVQLDVSSRSEINAAVRQCSDVTLLVNNAGAMFNTPILAPDAVDAMRKEMEVNVFGMASMIQAFAPILAKNGGGAIVNMLSSGELVHTPLQRYLCSLEARSPCGLGRCPNRTSQTRNSGNRCLRGFHRYRDGCGTARAKDAAGRGGSAGARGSRVGTQSRSGR